MNEKQKQFVDLKDTRLTKERLLEDQEILKKQSSEMSPDDWNLKMKSIEVEIMKARGDIYKMESDLGLDNDDPETKKLEEEALKEIERLEAEMEMVISSDRTNLDYIDEAHNIAIDINTVCKKINDAGYTVEMIEDLSRSENPKENDFYNIIVEEFDSLKISERIDKLEREKPNLMLDVLVPNVEDSYFKIMTLKNLSDNEDVHHSKIVDSFIKNIPKDKNNEDLKSLKESIDSRLIEEKIKTLENLPTEEVLDILISNPELSISNIENSLCLKTVNLCESYMAKKDIEGIKRMIEKLSIIGQRNRSNIIVSGLPKISDGVYFSEKETIKLFSGDMPQWIFNKYYSKIISGPFLNLVPEKFIKEKSFHDDIKDIESISLESVNEALNKFDLSFDELSVEEKNDLLKKGKESIVSLYSANDFAQILEYSHVDIDLIPSEFHQDLKEVILQNYIKYANLSNFDSFKNFLEKTNLTVVDFTTENKYKIFKEMNHSVVGIRKFFRVEDLREILINNKHDINLDSIPPEYMENLSSEIVQVFLSSKKIDYIRDNEKRNWIFDKIREMNNGNEQSENAEVNYEMQQKAERIKRIQESFYFIDQQEKVPVKLLEKFNNFKEKYGKKGEGIMALSVVSYGMEDLDKLMKRIEEMEGILDLYSKENIPEGSRVTQGIEYEVGVLNGEEFDKESMLGYVREAQLVAVSANINRGLAGSGSIYEHATRATDNPYMLMIEMKLLGDAGFVDLNHKDFENGARGYHSSVGGETGLSSTSGDMNFLYNTMTIASLSGLNLGVEIHSAKTIHQKTLDDKIFEKKQGGDRVEIKGMGCDCSEQFNKSIMTVHNSGIAIQVMNKYLKDGDKVLDKMPDDINSFEDFINENDLFKNEGFNTIQEKEITFTWLKFKKDMLLALRQHNNSFAQSEFVGYVENEKGEMIDTSEDIDINLNKKRMSENGIDYHDAEKMKELYYLPEESLFDAQNSEFLRNLGHVNNTFVFKEPILSEEKIYKDKITGKSHVKREFMSNAYSTLTNVRAKGYIKDVPGSSFDSIVDTKGEIRDSYYHYQGASEEMISHKSQIIVNEFNKNMKDLLVNISKDKLSMEKIEQYETAI